MANIVHPPLCSTNGCTDPVKARGLCRKHYQLAYRAERPTPKRPPVAETQQPGPSAGEELARIALAEVQKALADERTARAELVVAHAAELRGMRERARVIEEQLDAVDRALGLAGPGVTRHEGDRQESILELQYAAQEQGASARQVKRLEGELSDARENLATMDAACARLRDAAENAKRDRDDRLEGARAELTSVLGLSPDATAEECIAEIRRLRAAFDDREIVPTASPAALRSLFSAARRMAEESDDMALVDLLGGIAALVGGG